MKSVEIINTYTEREDLKKIASDITSGQSRLYAFKGLVGSSRAFVAATLYKLTSDTVLFIMNDKESAAYFYNDMEFLLGETDKKPDHKNVFFFLHQTKEPIKRKILIL